MVHLLLVLNALLVIGQIPVIIYAQVVIKIVKLAQMEAHLVVQVVIQVNISLIKYVIQDVRLVIME